MTSVKSTRLQLLAYGWQCYLLFAGICHWLKNQETSFDSSISEFPEHLLAPIQAALSCPAHVGWHQAVKGYFSKNWAALANMDMHHPTTPGECDPIFKASNNSLPRYGSLAVRHSMIQTISLRPKSALQKRRKFDTIMPLRVFYIRSPRIAI